ncbi:MAG: Fpg/Nei family DNA glycosylase, partial [Verrucomicrobiaceae bacterium]
MPELAEAAYYARLWHPGLNHRILRVHAGSRARFFRGIPAQAVRRALTDTVFLSARTHGKNLLFEFSGGLWLAGHLGMTGELLAGELDHVPDKHDHLVLYTPDTALVFRDARLFGGVKLTESPEGPPPEWVALPPEILSAGFTERRVAEALKRHARQPLKAFLLDQTWFPGIGNWMADEALFQLRLPPSTPCGQVDAGSLRKVLRHICRISLKTVGADWSDLPAAWLMRYRWKAGGHCPRCGAELARKTLRGRTACWCPVCQPGEEASPASAIKKNAGLKRK